MYEIASRRLAMTVMERFMVTRATEENMEPLSRAILKEAEVDAQQMREEAKNKADEIRKRAQDEAQKARDEILEKARQEADRVRSQSISSAQLKARTMQLEQREKLLDRVFQTAKEKLADVQKRSDYDQLAAMLLREALTQLRVNKAEIHADQASRQLLEKKALGELSNELKGQFTFADNLEEGRGIVVDAADGKLHYDNTLETRLQRLQSSLRASVYKLLMGEKL
jgi:V/A-type H+-transporting ATPase subunit E